MNILDNYSAKELEHIYFGEGKRFLVKYKTVYQLRYSNIYGFSLLKVYTYNGKQPLVARGRNLFTNASWVNKLIEKDLFVDY